MAWLADVPMLLWLMLSALVDAAPVPWSCGSPQTYAGRTLNVARSQKHATVFYLDSQRVNGSDKLHHCQKRCCANPKCNLALYNDIKGVRVFNCFLLSCSPIEECVFERANGTNLLLLRLPSHLRHKQLSLSSSGPTFIMRRWKRSYKSRGRTTPVGEERVLEFHLGGLKINNRARVTSSSTKTTATTTVATTTTSTKLPTTTISTTKSTKFPTSSATTAKLLTTITTTTTKIPTTTTVKPTIAATKLLTTSTKDVTTSTTTAKLSTTTEITTKRPTNSASTTLLPTTSNTRKPTATTKWKSTQNATAAAMTETQTFLPNNVLQSHKTISTKKTSQVDHPVKTTAKKHMTTKPSTKADLGSSSRSTVKPATSSTTTKNTLLPTTAPKTVSTTKKTTVATTVSTTKLTTKTTVATPTTKTTSATSTAKTKAATTTTTQTTTTTAATTAAATSTMAYPTTKVTIKVVATKTVVKPAPSVTTVSQGSSRVRHNETLLSAGGKTNGEDATEPGRDETLNPEFERDTTTTASLVAALCFGLLFLCAVLVLGGKRIYDGWQRRHYNKLDYLMNGVYN